MADKLYCQDSISYLTLLPKEVERFVSVKGALVYKQHGGKWGKHHKLAVMQKCKQTLNNWTVGRSPWVELR